MSEEKRTIPTQALAGRLGVTQQFFNRSTEVFQEEHSAFAPVPGLFTVAQHVAHTARTVDWFFEGAFRPEGFDMDFEQQDADARAVTSLTEARAWLARSFDNGRAIILGQTAAAMQEPMAEGPVMGGMPRAAILTSIADHTAHHRGALTVYARLIGLVPPIPYF